MPAEIETDDFRIRLTFFDGMEAEEDVAIVGGDEALIDSIHVGETRITRTDIGYKPRLKFQEITS